jgi:benzoylformate decarboxylase
MDLVDPPIDFLALAKSMGVPAQRLNTVVDIAPAIKAAIASGGPIILEIPIAEPERRRLSRKHAREETP